MADSPEHSIEMSELEGASRAVTSPSEAHSSKEQSVMEPTASGGLQETRGTSKEAELTAIESPPAYTASTLVAIDTESPTIKKLKSFYSQQPRSAFLPKLKWAYLLACVLGVCVDPFFFYIPIVGKEYKCIRLHQSVKIITISLRSTLDVFCLAHIAFISYNGSNDVGQKEKRQKEKEEKDVGPGGSISLLHQALTNSWAMSSSLVNRMAVSHVYGGYFALLPIPQIIFVPKLLNFSSLGITKFLSFLALIQYLPRVLRIYFASTEFNETPYRENEEWIYFKGGFSFFLYILSGHAIGSFWYFLAIQREATCWKDACLSDSSCEPTTFTVLCMDDPKTRNTTFLNDFCSIDGGNAPFNFGMFLDAAQDGVLESTNLWKKFCYCLWWGLRNLSSLAQNLSTSIYTWENIYAFFIAICGLLLVLLYLTSNMKMCMLLITRASMKKRVIRQLRLKDLDVQLWLKEHDLPKEIRTLIMDNVHRKLEQNTDVHVENILYILPFQCQKLLKYHLCMPSLLKVPPFHNLHQNVLEAMLEIFKPVNYNVNSDIIGEGEPLVMMLYITKGIILTYPSNNAGTSSSSYSKIESLQKGDVYGEEIVDWATKFSPFSTLPTSRRNVKSLSKVEALALMANDLKIVVARFQVYFSSRNMELDDSNVVERSEHNLASCIQSSWKKWKGMQKTKKGKLIVSELSG